ncbi:MAG: hypothetical protein IT437_04080 [Phycisphaerales bacterium]|nr:hypothetical protein [Phycisphaerales bacterium]
MKAVPAMDGDKVTGHRIFCPACRCTHFFNSPEFPTSGGHKWSFNGDTERPTFTPSMNMRSNPKDHPRYNPRCPSSVCHSFVTNGRIQYLGDCTHALAGQTIDLPDVPTEWMNG